ncbi:Sperm flagellar protein 2 [Phlyctochytrium bullatum]|nr:Sperm flagellar protein 2 [Phlyctochytrium bullatum]
MRVEDFERQVFGIVDAPKDKVLIDDFVYETSSALDPKEIKGFVSAKSQLDPVSHAKLMAKLLPSSEDSMRQTKDFIDRIRAKKVEEEASRKERDQRRRKIILGQQNAQEETERSHSEEVLLTKLLRQSKQERRIAEGLMQVRHQKEVMRENRVFRDQQYAKRRQRDYEEALQRERFLAQKAREEYLQQTKLQLAQHREILARKAAAKHYRNTQICSEIVEQILDMSLKVPGALRN